MPMWLYRTSDNDTNLYTIEKMGKKKLICIVTSPESTRPMHLDAMLKSVDGIASYNGFDAWQMMYVHARKNNYFENQNHEAEELTHKENLCMIRNTLEDMGAEEEIVVWAAWGEQIYSRDFLLPYLRDIYDILCEFKNVKWCCAGSDRHGTPRPPLYLASNTKLVEYDMEHHIKLS